MPGIEIISDLSKSKFQMETVEPINERTAKFYNVHNNGSHAAKIMDEKELFLLKFGLSMNILCTGNKLPVQEHFFKNSVVNLLSTLRFLGRLYNFCNFVIILSLM